MSLVKVTDISTGYSGLNVIENISFEINEGELVGVLGANGSGKSTLAKAVCNILPHEGTVSVNEKIIEELTIAQTSKLIGYIPQQSGIGIDISVLDVVMMGFNPRLKFFEKPDESMKSEAVRIIEKLGLGEKKDTNYMNLSEGQKQLTVLARALIGDGNLLVMDEPESALDFNVRIKTVNVVKDWIRDGDRAGLIILHDVMLALNNCDNLILLNDKRIAAIIDLHNDSLETVENKLKLIYGEISLVKVKNKSGIDNYVMLFETEAE